MKEHSYHDLRGIVCPAQLVILEQERRGFAVDVFVCPSTRISKKSQEKLNMHTGIQEGFQIEQ